MAAPHMQPVEDRSVWSGAELEGSRDWVYQLGGAEIAELEQAIGHAKRSGKQLHELTREDFPLAGLDAVLERIAEEVDDGRGFHLLRGLPVQQLGAGDSAIAHWGIGLRFGHVISQNAKGDLLGHVRDYGRKLGDKDVRGYDTNSELRFHNDECDIIALMCLQPSKEGGLSSIVSSSRVFNELLARQPAVLAKLFDGYIFSLMGEHRPGVGPVSEHRIPIFSWHAGRMSCRYTINTVLQASHYTGVELNDDERATLFAPLEAARTPGLALNFALQPGDIQIANNLATLHQRTRYVDFDDPARQRHLLRLWLASHHPRPLAREFEERFNDGYSFRRGIPVTRAVAEA